MDRASLERVRSFNRLLTQRTGALEVSDLGRGRPLGEARLIFEIGETGAGLRELRNKLGLDSGYLSRLVARLKAQGLIELHKDAQDGRLRRATLTGAGRAELVAYNRLSDRLAASFLEPLDPTERDRLTAAMGEVERLLKRGRVEIAFTRPDSPDARRCLDAYFREIAERFDAGFDPAEERSGPDDDLAPPGGCFVVARLEGAAVGCGGVKRIDEKTAMIKRIWTAPSARGLGVARRVLRTLEGAARHAGVTILRLDTNRALKEAHALYRKEGFTEIPRFNDNPYAHHWFEKRF
jgi:DNA-binding MarR family transcriptional regulator/GNAT superfamily N-acetyltransferase